MTILEQLKTGKKIKVKHPSYGFTIHASLKLEDNNAAPTIRLDSVNLPKKASKGEKLLHKLVHIYCFDVLCNNLIDDVAKSLEYQKLMVKFGQEKLRK